MLSKNLLIVYQLQVVVIFNTYFAHIVCDMIIIFAPTIIVVNSGHINNALKFAHCLELYVSKFMY